MEKKDALHEGKTLSNKIKGSGREMDAVAGLLGMTRQNLNYHLRKKKLSANFKRLLGEKYDEIFQTSKETTLLEQLSDTEQRLIRLESYTMVLVESVSKVLSASSGRKSDIIANEIQQEVARVSRLRLIQLE